MTTVVVVVVVAAMDTTFGKPGDAEFRRGSGTVDAAAVVVVVSVLVAQRSHRFESLFAATEKGFGEQSGAVGSILGLRDETLLRELDALLGQVLRDVGMDFEVADFEDGRLASDVPKGRFAGSHFYDRAA